VPGMYLFYTDRSYSHPEMRGLLPVRAEQDEKGRTPTKVGGQFEALFRLCGPEKPLFEKSWTLPDIVSVKWDECHETC
jgi:hypothetical protein